MVPVSQDPSCVVVEILDILDNPELSLWSSNMLDTIHKHLITLNDKRQRHDY